MPTTVPNMDARVQTIARELAKGQDRADIVAKYVKKWQISSRSIDRLINKAKPAATTIHRKSAKAKEEAIIQEETEAVRNGLKTKNERLMILQTQVDECLKELDLLPKNRTIERVSLRRSIRDMQVEIGKIEGDYELDNKQKQPVINLNDVEITFK